AFVHSVADRTQLVQANAWMIVCTVTYAIFSVQALSVLQFGSAGIVAANMGNMAMRIAYCAKFIKQWFQSKHLPGPKISEMLPHHNVALACAGSALAIIITQSYAGKDTLLMRLMSLGVGGLLGLAVLATIWKYERKFIGAVQDLKSGNVDKLKTD
ncbi:Oligosaccharide translocation protein rft1, partial [Linderina pennispora]